MKLFCLTSLLVRRPDKWRRHRCVRIPGRSRRVLAPCMLRVQHVQRAAGGSHLLLPGWKDLLWPAPRREAQATLHRLRRGERTSHADDHVLMGTRHPLGPAVPVTVPVELFLAFTHMHSALTHACRNTKLLSYDAYELTVHTVTVKRLLRFIQFKGVDFQYPDLPAH